MDTKREIIDVPINHPLEGFFEIEEGSTHLPMVQRETTLTPHVEYDSKDTEIESQLQEVYDVAMSAFEQQFTEIEIAEGKHKALVGEMAANFLNTALAAAKEKSLLKQHKDKLSLQSAKSSSPRTVNNNLVVADRNEVLRAILGKTNEN